MCIFCSIGDKWKELFSKRYSIVYDNDGSIPAITKEHISVYFKTKEDGKFIEKKLENIGMSGLQNFL